jgi:hypothetical protein
LATGCTNREAAQRANISEATLYRRLEDPAFKKRIAAIRREAYSRAVGKLSDLAFVSALCLGKLLASTNERIVLGAVRLVLEATSKGLAFTDLAGKTEELEALVKTLTDNEHEPD